MKVSWQSCTATSTYLRVYQQARKRTWKHNFVRITKTHTFAENFKWCALPGLPDTRYIGSLLALVVTQTSIAFLLSYQMIFLPDCFRSIVLNRLTKCITKNTVSSLSNMAIAHNTHKHAFTTSVVNMFTCSFFMVNKNTNFKNLRGVSIIWALFFNPTQPRKHFFRVSFTRAWGWQQKLNALQTKINFKTEPVFSCYV